MLIMVNDAVLCKQLGTTANQLREWLSSHETAQIAQFLKARFEERYFNPIESMEANKKNGFLTIAICCMTVEALESFRRGWPSSENHSKEAFRGFLTQQLRFAAFNAYAEGFYYKVRCGILHHGETKGGWRIRRSGPLFDPASLTINATRFHRQLHGVLLDYVAELNQSPYKSPIWKNARKKLSNVVANCERERSAL
jgi:hypothetical protein